MAKAFRNTGIEGGYASFSTSCWLAGQQRDAARRADQEGDKSIRWNISAAKPKPVKDSKSWRFEPDVKARAVLMKYAETGEPGCFGTWTQNKYLYGVGLTNMTKPPSRWVKNAAECYPMGAHFQITGRGQQYIEWLKSKGNNP